MNVLASKTPTKKNHFKLQSFLETDRVTIQTTPTQLKDYFTVPCYFPCTYCCNRESNMLFHLVMLWKEEFYSVRKSVFLRKVITSRSMFCSLLEGTAFSVLKLYFQLLDLFSLLLKIGRLEEDKQKFISFSMNIYLNFSWKEMLVTRPFISRNGCRC